MKRGGLYMRRCHFCLFSCGPHAFDVFRKALRYHYIWLSHDIDVILTRRMIDVIDTERSSPGSPNLPPQSPMTVTRETKVQQLIRCAISQLYLNRLNFPFFKKYNFVHENRNVTFSPLYYSNVKILCSIYNFTQ